MTLCQWLSLSAMALIAFSIVGIAIRNVRRSLKRRQRQLLEQAASAAAYSLRLEGMKIVKYKSRWCVLNEDGSIFHSGYDFNRTVLDAVKKLAD